MWRPAPRLLLLSGRMIVRNLERPGTRFAIGLALALFAGTVVGVLQWLGLI